MTGITEGQIIAALATVVISLAGVIARMAFHIRDLNKRLTEQAETHAIQTASQSNKHAKATQDLQTAWREESNDRAERHAELLLHTNRTLDALLRSKGLDNDDTDDAGGTG